MGLDRRRSLASQARVHRMAVEDGRSSQILRGVLDVCLLAVVSDEPAYGYEMTRRLSERGLSVVAEGSIYPLLGRLEKGGLVETFWQNGEGGPQRKYYRLTDAGQAALKSWSGSWRET